MGIGFNADEILALAIRIEQNGARFYFRAAENITEPPARDLFKGLAVLEQSHERTFAQMRTQLSDAERRPVTFDPQGEEGAYLEALANGRVFDVTADPVKLLNGQESVADVLRMAIGLEKDSILFYLGMRDLVPAGLGKDKVDAIIREEMRHIAVLSNELAGQER